MLFSALVALVSTVVPFQGSADVPSYGPDTVDVVRDAFGVPHVYAQTDAGAYYGLGWAAAEDRFFQMTYARLAIRGRLAEFLGRDPGDGSNVYLDHDREMRLIGFGRLADELWQAADPELTSLLQAYAQGVDDYVAQADSLHPNFAQFGFPIEPWSPSDSIAIWLRFGRFVSSTPKDEVENAHDWEDLIAQGSTPDDAKLQILGEEVFDEEAAVVQQSDVPQNIQQQMTAFAQLFGIDPDAPAAFDTALHLSQAWAVSGEATTSGETVVVSDPRLPLRVPNELWEAHFAGATFEARGATSPGSPSFLVGATRDVAWGVTALGMDQVDLFEIVTDPVDEPGRYFLDGQWVPFELSETETILVAGEAPQTVLYRETRWGPVVTRFPGDTLVEPETQATEEFALRWAPARQTFLVPDRAFLDMYRAPDAQAFGAALRSWTTPTVHCLFGDDAGTVGYWAVGALPVRASSSPLGGAAAQDGTTSASEWLAIVPHHLKPWVLDPAERFLLSANHLPVGAWYPIPLVTHGGYSNRAWRLRERLDLALPTPQSLAAPGAIAGIHADGVWPSARDIVRLGFYLRDQQNWPLTPKSLNALLVLEPFADPAGDGVLTFDPIRDGQLTPLEPKASALAYFNGRLAFRSLTTGGKIDPQIIDQYGFGDAGLVYFLRSMVERISQNPPVDLTNREASVIDKALIDGWNKAVVQVGLPPTWAPWFDDEHLSQNLERWRNIDGLPSLLPNQPIPTGPVGVAGGDTMQSQYQQTYTQYTRLGGTETIARSLLPLGQSEHEDGPHFDDQRPFWETPPQFLKPQPFERSELAGPTTLVKLNYLSTKHP